MKKMKAFFLRRWKNMKNSDTKAEWMVLGCALLFSMFTMFYSDFQGTMNWAYQTIADVYHGNVKSLLFVMTTSYGMTLFLLFAIWLIPFVPFSFLASYETPYFDYYGSLFGAIWSKLFLLIFAVVLLKAIQAIAIEINVKKENRKWILLFSLTSALFFLPVIEIGQCDIVGLSLSLWGLYYYLKDDRKKFILFFMIAIPMKYFPLMMFVPLVLLHEKKIGKILWEMLSGCSLLVLNILLRKLVIGSFMDGFSQESMGQLGTNGMTQNVIADAMGAGSEVTTIFVESTALQDWLGDFVANSPVFMTGFLIICMLAYAIRSSAQWKEWAIYLSALVYTGLLLFLDANPYRLIMLLPFYSLLVFMNVQGNRLRLSMILETLIGWAFLFLMAYQHPWVIGGIETFSFLFLKGIMAKRDIVTFFTSVVDLTRWIPYGNACLIASILAFFVCNRPDRLPLQSEDGEKFDRWIIWGRIALLLVWISCLLYVVLIRPI